MSINQSLQRVLAEIVGNREQHKRKSGWATVEDVTGYGITRAADPLFDMQMVAAALLEHYRQLADMGYMPAIVAPQPRPAVAPRPSDLEQLSSSGHGRVREIINGVTVYEAWYRNFKLHGEHGAALIERDEATGIVTKEVWAKKGNITRNDAPAFIERDSKTGDVTRDDYYIDGVRINAAGRAAGRVVEAVENFVFRLTHG